MINLKLYNTLTRKKEDFVPIEPRKVKMYSCGPTVYNYFHIGNARPFIIFDTLRRYLEYRGYEVDFVQNFTDIDDKMIKRANEEGITVKELADRFIGEYFTDAHGLGIKEATVHPKATENIDAIIGIINKLIEKGYAYNVNGDVYFRVKKFKDYGKLSHQPLENLEAGARIEVGAHKEDPMDFTVWKAKKEGEPAWESPWGEGRPGWHIECSAMVNKYLGETIDIHSGGQDLIFPHHENEIAQSEAANGVPFAHYWLHNGYINVDNRKMSKSLNNFFTVRDVAKEFDYDVIRFFMLSAHYRNPINFSQCDDAVKKELEKFRQRFIDAMDDDINTADAISVIFDLVKYINITADGSQSLATAEAAQSMLCELAGVLGIEIKDKQEFLDADIEKLIEERNEARKAKDFKRADEIRDTLKENGIVLEDTRQGVKWKRV